MLKMLRSFKSWLTITAKTLKKYIHALVIASQNEETPLSAKVIIIVVVAYAMSPIDLIPDFIPILGYLDDLVLLPLGISLAIGSVPKDIMASCLKETSEKKSINLSHNWFAGSVVIVIWCLTLYWLFEIFF